MLKYTTAQVTFREIPDEVTLCINISNCPIHCPDCHSKELWEDVGTELTDEELKRLIEANKGITCVCFMGYGNDLYGVMKLASLIRGTYCDTIKTALYSGGNTLYACFDYVKIGPYMKEFGGLDKKTTNQRLFRCCGLNWEDITYKFWKKD